METLRTYEIIDSTNLEAARLLAAGKAFHGLTILAYHQTNGRGQLGRDWYAEPGKHLAMSVILQPSHAPVSQLPFISMKVSLAIAKALQLTDPIIGLKIKWPNDIYAEDKKLAGILIENSLQSGKIQHSIIGIGMNVNEEYFSSDIPNAISLRMLTSMEHELLHLCKIIRNSVLEFFHAPGQDWKDEYDQMIFRRNEVSTFNIEGKIIKAVVQGVDSEGKIMLLDEQGESKSYFSHEIKWIL